MENVNKQGILRRFLEFLFRLRIIKTTSFNDLKKPIWLNIGGGAERKKGYVGVDIKRFPNCIVHDCTKTFPLPDGSVQRIISEHLLEHLQQNQIIDLLNECHRILEDKGIMRIAVPDYNNPKDKPYLLKGHDNRFQHHITLTTYDLMRSIVEKSNFRKFVFYHFWEEDYFHMKPVDYELGYIKRTPDNDKRNRKGNALRVTSLVIDLIK